MKIIDVEEKKKILNFISRLSDVAKERKWISHYDADSDSLVVRNPSLSKDVKKRYITVEFAFYLNDKSNIEGIFIEYFISNFIAHHKEFKPIAKKLKKKAKKDALVELQKKETQKLVPELENILLDSLIRSPDLQKVG